MACARRWPFEGPAVVNRPANHRQEQRSCPHHPFLLLLSPFSSLLRPLSRLVRPLAVLRRQLSPVVLVLVLVVMLTLVITAGHPAPALAGPVEWHEVPATQEGRQWWDSGSLRRSRSGNVSVLSRFQPRADDAEIQRASDLYVMEIACGEDLFRDTAINGLPQFGAEWQPAAGDTLISSVITEVCAAASNQLP